MLRVVVASLLLLLQLCAFSASSPTPTVLANETATPLGGVNGTVAAVLDDLQCPADCHCVVARHTHQPFLHAKCSSLEGLKAAQPRRSTLPIHSIDLSYLNLPRLAHALESLHDLTSIDLSHNELHEIGHLGRRIKKLNLKHNRITSAKLAKLPQHVQVLNLQHNDITYLPLELTQLQQLQTLELAHNAINCSCETLEVRNWLQERHVFMEHPVKCSQPPEARGKSWLQLRQADVCAKEKAGPALALDEEENELMLGDQAPVEGSAEHNSNRNNDEEEDDEEGEEEELGKAFMPIEKKATTPRMHDSPMDDVEGSGDLSEAHLSLDQLPARMEAPLVMAQSQHEGTTELPDKEGEDDEEDGSGGSGGGILLIPHGPLVIDDFDAPDADSRPLEQPATDASPSSDIFNVHLGIFDGRSEGSTDAPPVIEEAIVPVVHLETGADNENAPDDEVSTDGPSAPGEEHGQETVMHAKVGEQDDSNATYFLMGVIVLIVVGLLFYVAIKRCKQSREARADAENPHQTELLDMDKKHPGKPTTAAHFNGNEHVPLIGDKSKADQAKPLNGAGKKPSYDGNDLKGGSAQQQQALLNGSPNGNGSNGGAPPRDGGVPTINEPDGSTAPHEYFPITPRYPTPKSPRASKYAQHPAQGGEHNNNNSGDDAYLPSSPKSGRYSPVYSPETGRVKIKLTETPKPKTPMLVTRSKSNAGEIISTPVHVAPVGGANGHVIEH